MALMTNRFLTGISGCSARLKLKKLGDQFRVHRLHLARVARDAYSFWATRTPSRKRACHDNSISQMIPPKFAT